MKKLLPILFLLFSFAAVAQNTLSSIPPVVSGTDTYTVTVTGFPVSGGNAAILNRMFFARFTNANGGASTLVVNGLASPANLQKWDGSAWVALEPGDIPAGSDLKIRWDGTRFQIQVQAGGGGGSVTGPASSTDNAIVRFDGTTGKIIQNSTGNVITDAGLLQLGTLEAVSSDSSIFYGTSITAGSTSSVSTKRYSYLVAQGLQTLEGNRGLGGYSLQKPVGYGGSSFMNVYNTGSNRIGIKTAAAKYLFFAWGENDANNQALGVSGFDTTQFKTDYQTVVNYAITKGWSSSNIIIISPFWFNTTLTPLAIQQDYVRCARKFAATNGLKYIEDVFTQGAAYGIYIQAGDGKHPGDYGHSIYGNVILQSMAASINVKNNSQKLAVNGVTEVQSFKIRNLNVAADNAQVVGRNTDGTLSLYSPDRWVKMYGTDPGTSLRNTSNIFTDGLARFGTVTESSTGSFTGASWAYNNSLLISGITRMMVGVSSDEGYLWAFNGTTHKNIRIAELAGNVLMGTTANVTNVKLQVTGRGFYTTGAYFGSNVLSTARVHIAAETATSNTGPIKFTTPAARLSVAEAGVLGPETSGDDLTFTIATGTVNKKLVLADGTLTSTRVPFMTTNGRQTDDADFTFSSATDKLSVDRIQLDAGTATAGTPPLRFTSGTNLTTTESGAMEFNGSNLFFTYTNAGTRNTVMMTNTNQAVTGNNTYTGTNAFGNTVSIADASDGTKIAQLQVDQVSSSTTRTYDFPDASGTFALFGGALGVTEGSNATMGTATLSAGTVTVNTNKVTANSRIFLTVNGGTLTNVGSTYISARSAGTSFTISSTNVLDASQVAWIIIEPQ